MEVCCEQCNTIFSKSPSHVKRVKHVFCTKTCHDLFQTTKITKICVICSSPFLVEISQAPRVSTCSDTCRIENKQGANNPNWRGGKKKRGNPITTRIRSLHKYTRWKAGILARQGDACEICDMTENVQVHHISFARYHPWYMLEPSNGQVLCREHHQQLHRESLRVGESIAVDLDGTLAMDYEGEYDPEFIGEPVPIMLARTKRWIANGQTVKIFTARASDPDHIPPIARWLEKHGIGGLEITNRKTPDIKAIWDDKAISVIPNTGEPPEDEMFALYRELEKESYGETIGASDPNTFELIASLDSDEEE